MNKIQTFQEFLATQSGHVSLLGLVINLFLTALMAFILSRIYVRCGVSLSNRRMFAKNFIPLALTTMFIITVVKSSLALSLGLVGALSIVRFRAAIKEPEELVYLFINISIGLGMGADQTIITIVAFTVIALIMILRRRPQSEGGGQNLYLTLSTIKPSPNLLKQMTETLKKVCSAVDIKRWDETKEILEASFLVECDSFEKLQKAKMELQNLDHSVRVTFLDSRGGA